MKISKNNILRGGGHSLIYHPFIIRLIPENLSDKTIVDLGCGKGIYGYLLRSNKNCQDGRLIGVEGDQKIINFLKRFNIYDDIIHKRLQSINFKPKSIDYVLCTEVIEHLTKTEGIKLLDKIDKMCKDTAIITTPNILFQPAGEGNLDKHISLWQVNDFTSRDYRVYGLGIKLKPPTESTSPLLSQVFYGLEYLMTPFSYFIPYLGGSLLAIKKF